MRELRFRSGAQKQHDVICFEKIILPDWDRRTCPWCLESKSLARLAEQGRISGETQKEVIQRIMRLERSMNYAGLVEDAIWRPDGAQPLRVTMNSLFLDIGTEPCSEAAVIASVAAALQQMRNVTSDGMRLEATIRT